MNLRSAVLTFIIVLLSACGGGSGGSTSTGGGSTGGEQTGKDVRTLALSGFVTATGQGIPNPSVRAFDYRAGSQGSILASGTGTGQGAFSISTQVPKDFAGLVLVCAYGGTYIDNFTSQVSMLSASSQLCAMVNILQNGSASNINLTPFSEAHAQLTKYNLGRGLSNAQAFSQAITRFSDTFKFSHTVKPSLSVSNGTTFNDLSLSHLLLAGYSKISIENGALNGIMTVSNLLGVDILDGILDGMGQTSPQVTQGQLGIGNYEFTGQSYTGQALIEALTASSLDITTGMGAAALQHIDLYATPTSGSLVPSTQTLSGFDTEGPLIAFSHDPSTAVSGDFNLVIDVTDDNAPSITSITVNGIGVDGFSGSNYVLPISPSDLGTETIEIMVTAQDLFGNQSSKALSLTVLIDSASLKLTSETLVNNRNYSAVFEVDTGAIQSSTLLINGNPAAFNGVSYTRSVYLSGDTPVITVSFKTENGFSVTQTFSVAVDEAAPVANITGIDGHTIYVKELSASEATLKSYADILYNDEIYVDSSLQSLNGLAVTTGNIISHHLPVIYIEVDEDLDAFTFEFNNNYEGQIKTGDLVNIGTGWVLPLSTEYLGANWFENTGQQAIYFTATDLVGNASSITYQGYFTGWAPSLTTSITVSTVFGGSDATLEFNSEDFTGMDEVKLVINGVEYTASSITNPSFSVDFSAYASGQYYGYVKAYKDGVEVFSQRVDFTVSNEPSTITVTSPYYFNTSSPVLAGTAVNSQDGIASVLVGGLDASYQLFNNTFSRAFSNLPEGVHLATVKAISGSGYSNQITTEFAVDTTMPVATISDPGNGWYTGSTFTVSGTCADVTSGGIQSGVASMKLNGNAVSCSSSAYSHALAVTTGTNVITAAITDQAGNEGTATEYVKVDNVLPSGTITNPGASWRTGSSYTVTGTCSDAHSGVAGVTVNSKSTSCVNGEYSVSVPVTQGVNTLTTNVADMVGQTYSTNRTLNIDNTPAELEVTTPIYFTQADLDIRSTTTDAESGVTGVTVNGNNATWNTVDEQYSYRFYGIAEGVYPIDVVATNGAGLTTTVSNTYYIDRRTPIAAVDYPYPGQSYFVKKNNGNGTSISQLRMSNGGLYFCPENVALNGMATDDTTLAANGMIFVTVYIEDIYSNGAGTDRGDLEVWFEHHKNYELQLSQPLTNDGSGNYKVIVAEETLGQFYLNTSADDIHEIQIHAKDHAGNINTTTFSFGVHYDPASADW